MQLDNPISPAIFGIEGLTLTPDERDFFARVNPFGFILFKRNCQTRSQILALIKSLRSLSSLGDKLPIFIDEEGGRVRRLPDSLSTNPPIAQTFANAYNRDAEKGLALAFENYANIAKNLDHLSINANCVPCADLVRQKTHSIIGDRAFVPHAYCFPEEEISSSPLVVHTGKDAVDNDRAKDGAYAKDDDAQVHLQGIVDLCLHVIKANAKNHVLSTLKHIPGHGVATLDSHEQLPSTAYSTAFLKAYDFRVFKDICTKLTNDHIPHPFAMTAHVVFQSIDDQFSATQSASVIKNIIRDYIGFNGVLMTDCLSMKALSASYAERATRAVQAGCDVVLHCTGIMSEMVEIAECLPPLTQDAYQRYLTYWNYCNPNEQP